LLTETKGDIPKSYMDALKENIRLKKALDQQKKGGLFSFSRK
jgi:hypothetical protein